MIFKFNHTTIRLVLSHLSQNSESGDKKTPAKRCFHTALPESIFRRLLHAEKFQLSLP